LRRLVFSLVFVLGLTGLVSAQKLQKHQGLESGFYELTIYSNKLQETKNVVVHLRRKGDSLELVDPFTNTKYKSKIVEYRGWGMQAWALETASFELANSKSTLSPGSRVSFASTDKGVLMGTWEYKDEQAPVQVRAVTVLWACGNHENPTHTAESEAEMNQKSQRYGCKDWHQLRERDIK